MNSVKLLIYNIILDEIKKQNLPEKVYVYETNYTLGGADIKFFTLPKKTGKLDFTSFPAILS